MEVTVNDDTRELPEGATLVELLRRLDLEDHPLAVEINRHVVPREAHAQTHLCEGDHVEIVTLVGGG